MSKYVNNIYDAKTIFFFFSKMRKKSKSIIKRKIFDSHPVFNENY